MSMNGPGQALKFVAFIGMALGSASLAGCSSLGFSDVTGSTMPAKTISGAQTMPPPLASTALVAEGPYLPPNNIGGGSSFVTGAPAGGVATSALPPLASSSGNTAMSAQPSLASAPVVPRTASLGAPPELTVVPAGSYIHVIESGESLYTIARRYDVTAQAIVQANGMASPDKIFVGQRLIIPGRPDLLAAKGPAKSTTTASLTNSSVMPLTNAATKPAAPVSAAIASPQPLAEPPAVKPIAVAKVEPAMSGADKFRWPISGKVITDFITSKQTGINIEAPEGAAVRAAENGQVIYVGNGVEGYGNLILIRHPNGYVSAYAHLKSISVTKGSNVNRGDTIGAAGMTGSVTRPQLHFELRKGATPVDPIPMLAG